MQKQKKRKITNIKFALDSLMAVTFVLFFNKRVLGGLTFHEIAGLAIGVAFFTHIALNWRWVKNVTLKLFDRKLPAKTKWGYVLNLLLLITMAFIIISGILISRVVFPNINFGNEQWFKMSHMAISYIALILVAAHVGLHWKWVINVFKDIVKVKTSKPVSGIIAKVMTVGLLVFGSYEIYTTNFINQVGRVTNVFSVSSSQTTEGNFHGGEKPDFAGGDFEAGDRPNFAKGSFEAGDRADFADGDVKGGEFDKSARTEGGFKGVKGEFGKASVINVIVQYFGIMAVLIIIIYYLDKWLGKNKRKKQQTNRNKDDELASA
ncbi:DUF4405 domain-containing protein [Neobacillus dielmonensis]|uniref:DUF4405 domain-containing protein n=1 Tax=Neobacillus dielmonensis TaxID=1347369 RepID=UPI0005A9CA79|nr:DUF4405 domain-containing protein [Neobacillus dielmonensis]